MRHRVAFYPCCGPDIERPLDLLRLYADEVIFCDINKTLRPRWQRCLNALRPPGPRPTFLIGHVRQVISQITWINVLFYRRDSDGEGGSGGSSLGTHFFLSYYSGSLR